MEKDYKKRRVKSLIEFFYDYTEIEFLEAIEKLSERDKELLIEAYGEDYNSIEGFYSLSNREKDKLADIRKRIRRNLIKTERVLNNQDKKIDIPDTKNSLSLFDLEYKPLSRRKELSIIKRSKLAFYNDKDVDDNLKEEYLSYYFEEYPRRKKRYYKVLNEITFVLLVIENELTRNITKERLFFLRELLLEKENERQTLLNKYIEDAKIIREDFIKNNQGLIFSIITKRHPFKYNKDELVSEGNIGALIALKRFDVNSGNKFSTYASYWIRQKIERYLLEKEKTIRIPVHKEEKIVKIIRAEERLSQKLFRPPTIEELADELNMPVEFVEELLEFQKMSSKISSLNLLLVEDDDAEMEMFFGEDDDSFQIVEDEMFKEELRRLMNFANLQDIEKAVIIKRLGLDDDRPCTLREVGQEKGLSREGVRKIERNGYSKILKYTKGRDLFDMSIIDDSDISQTE